MQQKILIGDNRSGLVRNKNAFNVDNDAYVTLFNAYVWRGSTRRKRGTSTLDRLKRQIVMVTTPSDPWDFPAITLSGGAGNLLSGLETNASIVPGTLSLVLSGETFTEPATADGTLVGDMGGSGTIVYQTGDFTITGGGAGSVTGTYSYYPNLPVMGLRDIISNSATNQYPLLGAFDTTYSYQINQSAGKNFYSTSYYKGTNNPVTWSNTDDSQYWTTNFQSAFWATNNKAGFHFVTGTYTSGSTTTDITFNFQSGGSNFTDLIVGDVLWFNEWNTGGSTINGLNGTVSDISGAASGNYVVTFDSAQTVAGTGIAQLLTNSIPGQDGIRWYDGDPTGGTGIPTATGLGWVNFAPPLTAIAASINDVVPDLYYLVGALIIVEFKDRLVFFGPIIQAAGGTAYQRPIQDTAIYSWNGPPYYNALVPTGSTVNESYDVTAYYVDQTGKGGFQSAGVSLPALTVTNNEDVLLVGFGGSGKKTRFVYTGNDIQPFLFYLIDSEFPSTATFSAVEFDRGAMEIGAYGITLTTQQSCDRVDLQIPDIVFEIQAANNGVKRINSLRDYYREWIYFSYPYGSGKNTDSSWKYPTRSFFYNYRDVTWAIFKENFTAHGTFRLANTVTWQTLPFKTWNVWRQPWNDGSTVSQFPSVIAGNPQGYVVIKDDGTNEAPTGAISAIADNGVGFTTITSANHCVEVGDYLYFTESIGSTFLNTQIGKVTETPSTSTFEVDIEFVSGTYLGLGKYTRLSQPLIQTKQFPVYWEQGRKTRLVNTQLLFDTTSSSQVTMNIYLSMDPDKVYNGGNIVPQINVLNNALIYSRVVFTCPESANIGLTPSNYNLQMLGAIGQKQIWHRNNTSLIGDTIQIGITLSEDQMKNLAYATSEITMNGLLLTVAPGPNLS